MTELVGHSQAELFFVREKYVDKRMLIPSKQIVLLIQTADNESKLRWKGLRASLTYRLRLVVVTKLVGLSQTEAFFMVKKYQDKTILIP